MPARPPSELTTIYVGSREFVSILEAHLAAEGIPSYSPLEGAADYGDGFYGWSANCALQVPFSHAERALAIASRAFPPMPARKRNAVPSWIYAAIVLVILVVLLISGF